MPYKMTPNGDGTYRVINSQTGRVHSKRTTKAKAEAQLRLLRGREHGLKPRRSKR